MSKDNLDQRWRVLKACFVALVLIVWIVLLAQFATGAESSFAESGIEPATLKAGVAVEVSEGKFTQALNGEFPFRMGGKVSLDNVNGAVRVTAWDHPKISVLATKQVRLKTGVLGWLASAVGLGSNNTGQANKHLRALRIDIEADDTNLTIDTHFPRSHAGANLSVEYELRVPISCELSLKSVNGAVSVSDVVGAARLTTVNGKVAASNHSGPVHAETTNGKVSCETAEGNVEARTVNGSIDVHSGSGTVVAKTTNGSVDVVHSGPPAPDGKLDCDALNGSIKVRLPAQASFSLEAETTNGKVTTDFPLSDTRKSDRNHLWAEVGTGGATISLNTFNGSVSVRPL
jgi:putative adhesin